MSRLVPLVVRSRPRFWLYLAGPVLVGLAFGAPGVSALASPIAIGLVAYFLFPANAFLYGVNDVFDAAVDVGNPKKAGRERRYRGDRITPAVVAGSAALGLVVAWLAPAPSRPYLVGFLVLGAAYSAPPLRLKTVPPLDSLSNGLYVLPGAAAYAAVSGAHPPALALLGGWLWSMGMHTLSAVPDIEPDVRAGIRTTATVLGRPGALAYCAAAWTVAAWYFGALDLAAGGLLLVYPAIVAGVYLRDVAVDRIYWYFPAVNAVVGAAFTLAGLWGLAYG